MRSNIFIRITRAGALCLLGATACSHPVQGSADVTSAKIGLEGGEASSPDRELDLTFPPGSLAHDQEIRIRVDHDGAAADAVTPTYELEPHGLAVGGGALIEVSPGKDAEDGEEFVIVEVDGDGMHELESSHVDEKSGHIQAQLDHLSKYRVVKRASLCRAMTCGEPCGAEHQARACSAHHHCVPSDAALDCALGQDGGASVPTADGGEHGETGDDRGQGGRGQTQAGDGRGGDAHAQPGDDHGAGDHGQGEAGDGHGAGGDGHGGAGDGRGGSDDGSGPVAGRDAGTSQKNGGGDEPKPGRGEDAGVQGVGDRHDDDAGALSGRADDDAGDRPGPFGGPQPHDSDAGVTNPSPDGGVKRAEDAGDGHGGGRGLDDPPQAGDAGYYPPLNPGGGRR